VPRGRRPRRLAADTDGGVARPPGVPRGADRGRLALHCGVRFRRRRRAVLPAATRALPLSVRIIRSRLLEIDAALLSHNALIFFIFLFWLPILFSREVELMIDYETFHLVLPEIHSLRVYLICTRTCKRFFSFRRWKRSHGGFSVVQKSNQSVLVSRRKLQMKLIHQALIPMEIINLIKVIAFSLP
jgi:hypothetical protein